MRPVTRPPAPLRCLIDSMIFDAIALEPGMLARVDRLTAARRLALLAAVTSIEQLAATPDPAHRRRLQRVRVLVVPPADDDPRARPLLDDLRALRVDRDDALIAAAAVLQEAPLVTEDRGLREARVAACLRVALWDWANDLRPRILALEDR
jgi:predicted nucleic acid-binding protein